MSYPYKTGLQPARDGVADRGMCKVYSPAAGLMTDAELKSVLNDPGRKRARDSGLNPKSGLRPTMPYEGKVPLGKVTVKGSQVFWNAEPLQGEV